MASEASSGTGWRGTSRFDRSAARMTSNRERLGRHILPDVQRYRWSRKSASVESRTRSSKSHIPTEYHFIFALTPDSKPFSFIHFLAIASCRAVNHPRAINLYCKYEPSGLWWERAKPYVTVIKVEPRIEIFGHPLTRPEHMADVMRLEILLEKGGVYLDVDVISIRPFAPLLRFRSVLGEELGVGLCNAVILARPGATFLKTWLDEYKSFNEKDWNGHSVRLPLRLSRENPRHVHVVDHQKFFWPTHSRADLRAFFLHTGSQFCRGSYCTHLWESLTWPFVRRLGPSYVFGVDSEFCLLTRAYVRPEWACLVTSPQFHHSSLSGVTTESVARSGILSTLRESMACLPLECREAVILCGLVRMTAEEAAVVLECSAQNALSNFHRGCDLLGETWDSFNRQQLLLTDRMNEKDRPY